MKIPISACCISIELEGQLDAKKLQGIVVSSEHFKSCSKKIYHYSPSGSYRIGLISENVNFEDVLHSWSRNETQGSWATWDHFTCSQTTDDLWHTSLQLSITMYANSFGTKSQSMRQKTKLARHSCFFLRGREYFRSPPDKESMLSMPRKWSHCFRWECRKCFYTQDLEMKHCAEMSTIQYQTYIVTMQWTDCSNLPV